MSTTRLRAALPAVCRAITRQKGIRLVFQGPPRTDGRVIYSNPLPVDANDDQVKIIIGDIDHECGHVLYSDFDWRAERLAEEAPERRAFLASLSNAVEDTFEERRLSDEYIGCRATLADSVELMVEDLIARPTPEDEGRRLADFVDAWGRVEVLEQRVEPVLDKAREALGEVLGQNGVRKLEALLRSRFFSVNSTQDGWALTKEIEDFLDNLEDEDEESEHREQPKEGAGKASQDDTASSMDGGDQADPLSGNDGGNGQEASGPSQSHPGAQRILGSSPDEKPLFDRRDLADRAIEAASQTHYVPHGMDAGLEEADDAGTGIGAGIGGEISFENSTDEVFDAVKGQVQRLTRQLVQEYQTRIRRRSVASEEGRLDSRRLYRASFGDRRVYRQRLTRQLPKPAVSLVIDGSGSMSGRKIELAVQAAATLVETNRHLDVVTALMAFAGDRVMTLKTHDQPWSQQVRERLASVTANGGTPMTDALWRAGCGLLRRRESRKLLFLITDGLPNDPEGAVEVSQMLQRAGVEVYGLGIGTDAVSDYCQHAAVVDDPEDIAEAILSALRHSLARVA